MTTIADDGVWEYRDLNSLTPPGNKYAIVDGPFGSNLKTIHYRSSGIPIVTSGFVTSGRFIASKYIYVDREKFEQEKRSAVRPGDIVMAKIGARCGASAILPRNHPVGILSGNALKITIDEARHSTQYVAAILRWLYDRGDLDVLRSTGAQPAISMPLLKKLQIPVPSRTEQQRIAAVLDETDYAIATLERLIAKKQAIMRGMMQQLLTGRQRMQGFDAPWKLGHLRDVLRVRHGRNQRGVETSSGRVPILATGGQIGWADRPLYSKPSVLIGRKGTIDRPQYQDRPFWTVDTLFYTEISDAADPRFLYYLFLTIDWRSMNEASGVPSLNSTRVESVECRLPTIDEQIAIRKVLDDADREIELLRSRLVKAKRIKQGMMQQLLTGRTRLPVGVAS